MLIVCGGRELPERLPARLARLVLAYFDPAVTCTSGRRRQGPRRRACAPGESRRGVRGVLRCRPSVSSDRSFTTAWRALCGKPHDELPLPPGRRDRELLPDPDLALLAERLPDADAGTVHVLHAFRARGLSEADFASAREALEWAKRRRRIESPVRYLVGVLKVLLQRREAADARP
jgi:hypothetical protein